MDGYIHSVQTMGTVDGPGVRFLLFMQGCPLKCACCHNPDTLKSGGNAQSAADVLEQVLRYRPYFGTDGGITVSGGEPLLQEDFLIELFTLCKSAKIHTCLDTSGFRITPKTKALLAVTDLVLLDIKYTNEADYRRYVGCELSSVLNFLQLLNETNTETWLRHVIIPTLNDNEASIKILAALSQTYACVKKTELLPFQKLCLEKYEALGLRFPLAEIPAADSALMDKMNAFLDTFLA